MSMSKIRALGITLGTGAYIAVVVRIFRFLSTYAVNWPHIDDFISIDWYNDIVNKGMLDVHYLLYTAHDNIHPLATQALISTAVFDARGVDYKFLIILNAVVVLSSALTLSYLSFKFMGVRFLTVLESFALLLVFFHPIQISHLLWAFELGWFLVNMILVVNAALIESSLKYRMAVVLSLCFLGAFCSAQGAALWVAAGLHIALRDLRASRYWLPIFFLLGSLNIAFVVSLSTDHIPKLLMADSLPFFVYFLQLLGALFSKPKHTQLLLHGILVGVSTVILLFHSLRSRHASAIQRTASVLILTSLMFLLQFAYGRYQYTIDWAVGDFHVATLLIPLLAGIVVSSSEWFLSAKVQSKASRMAVLAPCLYVVASVFYSLHFANKFAKESKVERELARHFGCQENAPPYVDYSLNLGVQYKVGYLRVKPFLRGLCKGLDSEPTRRLVIYPPAFTRLAAERPETRQALDALWQVYLTDFGLMRAFPSSDPKRGERLLDFAVSQARAGSHYAPELLKAYEPVFLSIGRDQ